MKLPLPKGSTARLGMWLSVFVMVLALCGTATTRAAESDEDFNSPAPIFISDSTSTRALAVETNRWRGALPKGTTEVFKPGADSRVTLFVTNLDLLPDENANAVRVYAEDGNNQKYRLTVESLAPLVGREWIYAVTVRLFDENGYNGQLAENGDVLLRLTWRGLTSNRIRLGIGRAGGGLKDDEGAVPTPAPDKKGQGAKGGTGTTTSPNFVGLPYSNDRTRFMEQAAFGPSTDLNNRLKRIGIRSWIAEQFQTPFPTNPYPTVTQRSTDGGTGCPVGDPNPNCLRDVYSQYLNQNWLFSESLYGQNQLKLRTMWALSQIWVVSGVDTQQARWEMEYIKLLDKHAFGNYRNLMGDMTLNPAMGNYLDMIRSTKNSPNENYPREIMQLFTIGLYELNEDGSQKLDANNNPIPTYDQDKVTQITKVFTGWQRCDSGPPTCLNGILGTPNYIDPVLLITGNHDLTAKSLFNYTGATNPTIAACTGCTTSAQITTYANNSLNQTLDNIFNHPNVPPFVSKLLIQQLVMSDPSPAYVNRISQVFKNNGQGARGDMKAVIRAILLDPEARGDVKTDPDYGKLREPLQLTTNLLRHFAPMSADRLQPSDGYINPQTTTMGQNTWNSPTVFNYFPPDYVVPGTDVTGPEFAIQNTATAFARANFVNTMVYSQINGGGTNNPLGTSISLAEAQAWATTDTTGALLVDNLNKKMLHGTMSSQMRSSILTAVQSIAASATNSARDRTRQAVYLIATSSQYQVQR